MRYIKRPNFRQNSKSKINDQSGFTITELLIAVAVGAIASVLIMTAYVFAYGGIIVEQSKTAMTLKSQQFLRKMIEDIRVANEVRTSNLITDPSSAGWTTSDPANILIVTQPVTDSMDDFIYEPATGYPYQNEIIYFGDISSNVMYRRILANDDPGALGNQAITSYPVGTVGFVNDIELINNLDNLFFEFYDIDDNVTSVPEEARSIEITVNLRKQVYGRNLTVTNTSRVTLRNEN